MLALSLMYYYYNAWSCDSTPCTELGRFNTDLLLQMTSGNVTLETWQWFPTVGRNTKRTELHTKLLVILHFFIQVEMLYPSFLLLVYCIPALYFNSSKWKRAYYKKELSYLLIVLSQFNSKVHKIEKLKIIPWIFFSSSHIEISPYSTLVLNDRIITHFWKHWYFIIHISIVIGQRNELFITTNTKIINKTLSYLMCIIFSNFYGNPIICFDDKTCVQKNLQTSAKQHIKGEFVFLVWGTESKKTGITQRPAL